MKKPSFYILATLLALSPFFMTGQEQSRDEEDTHDDQVQTEAPGQGASDFDPGATALHHIANSNAFHVLGDWYVHLPCILYSSGEGWTFLSSTNAFEPEGHGNGTVAIDRYVLKDAVVLHVDDPAFPMGKHDIDGYTTVNHEVGDGEVDRGAVIMDGNTYPLESKSSLDGGLVGGGLTGYYDFSITKNVFTLILVSLLLFWLFYSIARRYKKREGEPPRGIQSLIEPVFLFVQDEIAKPFLGNRYMDHLSLLLALFFFILGLNLFGQIPFFPGSANVTGNIAVTFVLAMFAFIVTNINGTKHYWEHIFWMPGIPTWVKFVLTPVEFLGLFIKPFTLMLRLFANIAAGHIVILCFVGLIFVFGNAGESMTGTTIGVLTSIPLTLFMMAIELLVAFIQAYIFAILTASYIGAAIQKNH